MQMINKQETQTDARTQAVQRLMEELDQGQRSGEENGWLTLEAVEASLGIQAERKNFSENS